MSEPTVEVTVTDPPNVVEEAGDVTVVAPVIVVPETNNDNSEAEALRAELAALRAEIAASHETVTPEEVTAIVEEVLEEHTPEPIVELISEPVQEPDELPIQEHFIHRRLHLFGGKE